MIISRILVPFIILIISMSTVAGLPALEVFMSESKWIGSTIYIRVDGSIEPPDAPIVTYDNITYIVVRDIQIASGNGIVIERDNIILDGNGHSIIGSGRYIGVWLLSRRDVTVKYLTISRFSIGIFTHSSLNTMIFGNNILVTKTGVVLENSSNNVVSSNTIYDVELGVSVTKSDNNTIIDNALFDTETGIYLLYSNKNVISGNNLSYTGIGIGVDWSESNNISNNNIFNTRIGAHIVWSENNNVASNVIEDNYIGVSLRRARDNVFLYNNFLRNSIQIYLGDYVGYNVWDDGRVGNYWSNHYCYDNNGDGVCENPYVIRDPDNVDRYPSAYPLKAGAVVSVLAVFVRALGGDVWYGLITKYGSVDWRPLGGIVAEAPSAAVYNNKVYVVARSIDGAIWYGFIDPRDWSYSGWFSIEGLAGSKPSITSTDYGVAIAVRDFNNGIWIGLLNESSVRWKSLPGATVCSPAITYFNGELHIVVVGLDGYTIWHGIVEIPSLVFKGWNLLYGFTNSSPELLATRDTLYLAVRDLGNGVALTSYKKHIGWLDWFFIPGKFIDTSPSLAYFNGRVVIAIKAMNDQSIWLLQKDHHGRYLWTTISGLTTHEPELITISINRFG